MILEWVDTWPILISSFQPITPGTVGSPVYWTTACNKYNEYFIIKPKS